MENWRYRTLRRVETFEVIGDFSGLAFNTDTDNDDVVIGRNIEIRKTDRE